MNNGLISVAMATYNGEKYIKEQIESILCNLKENDELIISDDGSTDNTINIIKELSRKDNRIKLYDGPQKGIKQNFANAISHCNNKYIFLSDQDDIWKKDKVKKVIKEFDNPNTLVVQHDAEVINQDLNVVLPSYFKYRKCGRGILKNIYKGTYLGCCMAFDSKLKKHILPIPENIDMHDTWIGIIGDVYGKNKFINDKLISYRRHGDNNSDIFHHHNIKTMIHDRICLIKELIKEKRR